MNAAIYFAPQICYNSKRGEGQVNLIGNAPYIIANFSPLVNIFTLPPTQRFRAFGQACANQIQYVPVAQLDRVSDSDSEGRKFESCRAYHVRTSSHRSVSAERRKLHSAPLFFLSNSKRRASSLAFTGNFAGRHPHAWCLPSAYKRQKSNLRPSGAKHV